MNEKIVVNTSPLLSLSKMRAFDVIGRLPLEFICPEEVEAEILAGAAKNYDVSLPRWLKVVALEATLSPLSIASLDKGEAAVIQLAVEQNIKIVCIDEQAGRRAAKAVGLNVVGSLGLLSRAKSAGLINAVKPYIKRAVDAGIYYDDNLIKDFLNLLNE